jgi:hypothetical protein
VGVRPPLPAPIETKRTLQLGKILSEDKMSFYGVALRLAWNEQIKHSMARLRRSSIRRADIESSRPPLL